jgi:outer membrane receptor protein involved in Fe transport
MKLQICQLSSLHKAFATCLSISVLCMVSAEVWAQEAVSAGPLQDIEEIIVTARKKEERLQDVPLSISPFTADTIEQLRLVRMNDIARFTPGFSFTSATGRQPTSDRPVIRGLTTIRNGIANSNVAATFVDGVYLGGSTQTADLLNLERVEVIRGPQQAQYGRGTYAGAINYVTRRPADKLESEVFATVAEHDTHELHGWVSGPLTDTVGAYIGASHREYGGEYKNIQDGSTVGGEESQNLSAKLYWTPTDQWDISLKLGLQNTDDDHYAMYLQPRMLNNCCFRTAEAPRAREYYVGEAQVADEVELYTDILDEAGDSGIQLDRRMAALDLRWTSESGYTLSSVTGYVDDDLDHGFDSSYAAYDPFSAFPFPLPQGTFTRLESFEQQDFSQEFRLSSPDEAVLRWTAGVYYYDGEVNEKSSSAVYLDAGNNVVVDPSSDLAEESVENIALFGSVGWDFSRDWSGTVELRWAEDEVSLKSIANDGSGTVNESYSEVFSSFTPRFTLAYQNNDTTNYYVTIAKGINPGDFNEDVPVLPDGSPDESYRAVDEEELWSYELGMKGQWWEQRLQSNLAAYYLDVTDQQLTTLVETPDGTASIIQNVGKTEVYGLEADVTVFVTDYFSVAATYAYTHAEITEHIDEDEADLRGSDGSIEDVLSLGDVSGNRVPRVPEHMASLVLSYRQPVTDLGSWYLIGDYTYESSKFAQIHNLIETGEQSLVGLRTGFDAGRWDVSLWVKNLFDDDTPVDIQRFLDSRSGLLGSFPDDQDPDASRPSSLPRGFGVTLPRGRQLGATFRYRF